MNFEDLLYVAWKEVPEKYVQNNDHDNNLADSIRMMAADLLEKDLTIAHLQEEARKMVHARSAAADHAVDQAYKNGRHAVANELRSNLEAKRPGEHGSWYVTGYCDAVIAENE